MEMNKQVIIDSLPEGKLVADNYRIIESPIPKPDQGEVLVKTTSFAITA